MLGVGGLIEIAPFNGGDSKPDVDTLHELEVERVGLEVGGAPGMKMCEGVAILDVVTACSLIDWGGWSLNADTDDRLLIFACSRPEGE